MGRALGGRWRTTGSPAVPALAWSGVLPIAAAVAVAQLVAAAVGGGYWCLCTGRREPWVSFWPQLRHLTVS